MEALIDRLLASAVADDLTFRGCNTCRLGSRTTAKVARADDAAVRAFRAQIPSQTSTPTAKSKVRLVPAYRRP